MPPQQRLVTKAMYQVLGENRFQLLVARDHPTFEVSLHMCQTLPEKTLLRGHTLKGRGVTRVKPALKQLEVLQMERPSDENRLKAHPSPKSKKCQWRTESRLPLHRALGLLSGPPRALLNCAALSAACSTPMPSQRF